MANTEDLTLRPRLDFSIASVLLILGLASRLFGIWIWPIYGDEVFTISDAIDPAFPVRLESKPAMYFLVRLSMTIFGVSEWSLRLPSALFGAFGIPAFYLLSRPVLGRMAALFGASFLLLSSWHLLESQVGRFYAAVAFFAILTFFWFFQALETGKGSRAVLALFASFFGILFHQTFAVIPATCAVVAAVIWVLRPAAFPNARKVSGTFLIPMILATPLAVPKVFLVLSRWSANGLTWGYSPFRLLLASVEDISVALVVGALAGTVLIIREDRWKATMLIIPVGLAVGGFLGLAPFMDVRSAYFMGILPLVAALSGRACQSAWEVSRHKRVLGLFPVVLVAFGMLPNFVSHYSSGLSYDLRDAVQFVSSGYESGDRVINFKGGFSYYWFKEHGIEPQKVRAEAEGDPIPFAIEPYLGDPNDPSVDWRQRLEPYLENSSQTWIVVESYRTGLPQGLRDWLFANARLVWQQDATRYDWVTETLQVFVLTP